MRRADHSFPIQFPLLFLGREDLIDVVGVHLILSPCLVVLLLSHFKDVVEFNGLIIKKLVNCLFQCLLLRLLGDLLLTPILLL